MVNEGPKVCATSATREFVAELAKSFGVRALDAEVCWMVNEGPKVCATSATREFVAELAKSFGVRALDAGSKLDGE